jgi:hypothetical protein
LTAMHATMAGMSWHHVPKDDAWKQAHLAMLARLRKRAWLHCDGCRHSKHHDRAPRARPAASARHADAAAHDLKSYALHALRGAEGVLLAGAAQYGRRNPQFGQLSAST